LKTLETGGGRKIWGGEKSKRGNAGMCLKQKSTQYFKGLEWEKTQTKRKLEGQ